MHSNAFGFVFGADFFFHWKKVPNKPIANFFLYHSVYARERDENPLDENQIKFLNKQLHYYFIIMNEKKENMTPNKNQKRVVKKTITFTNIKYNSICYGWVCVCV